MVRASNKCALLVSCQYMTATLPRRNDLSLNTINRQITELKKRAVMLMLTCTPPNPLVVFI